MKLNKPSDCLLFINDEMAKLVVAWGRIDMYKCNTEAIELPDINYKYSPKKLAEILNISLGQVRGLVAQAILVGIIMDGGKISYMAQKCVNALLAKKAQEFK